MDPKLHPNSSCMICCNANQSKISKKDSTTRKVIKNFDKCLKHYVKYYGNSEDEILDSNKLKEGDQVAVINQKRQRLELKIYKKIN